MNERDDKQLGESKRDKTSFLSRWSERKKQSALVQNTADTNDNTSEHLSAESKYTEQVDDSEETLTDTELLQKYNLQDPAEIMDEKGLDQFFNSEMPERLRQMALRRLWRINPFFGFVDEMVEYGEDYTDAATVIDGMQTAYQAGKGYLQKTLEEEKEIEESENITASNQDATEGYQGSSGDKGLTDSGKSNDQDASAESLSREVSDNRIENKDLSEVSQQSSSKEISSDQSKLVDDQMAYNDSAPDLFIGSPEDILSQKNDNGIDESDDGS